MSLLQIANLLSTDVAKQRARAALLVAANKKVSEPLPAVATKADETTWNQRRMLARQVYLAADHWVGQMQHAFALAIAADPLSAKIGVPDDALKPAEVEAVDNMCVAGFTAIYDQFVHMVVPQ